VVVLVVVAVVGGGEVVFVVTGLLLVVVAFGVLDVVEPDGPVVAVVAGPVVVAGVVGAFAGRVVDAFVDSRPLALVRVFFLLWSGRGSKAPGGAPAVALAM
jgi:hypothetical protein